MDRTERIELRLTPEEKEEIDEYIEEGGYSDRSQMLRTLAKKETRGDMDTASIDPDEIVNAVEIAFSELTENIEEINDRIAEIDQRIREGEDDIDKLARDIYNELPRVGSEHAMRDLKPLLSLPTQELQMNSTPVSWGEYFDEPVVRIRRALGRAMEYYPDVKYLHSDDGHRRYYVLDHDLQPKEGHLPGYEDEDSGEEGE